MPGFDQEDAINKIKEIFKTIIKLSDEEFIANLKLYVCYLKESFPKDSKNIEDAILCLKKLQSKFSYICLGAEKLSSQIKDYTINEDDQLLSYSKLLFAILNSHEMSDFMEYILPIQLESKPDSAYFKNVYPLLDQMKEQKSVEYEALKIRLGVDNPQGYLFGRLGDMLRFYTVIALSLKFVEHIPSTLAASKILVSSKELIDELAITNDSSIIEGRVVLPNKMCNESKSVFSKIAFFENSPIEKKEPSENKRDQIVKKVDKLICLMNLKHDKYNDTKMIIQTIKNYREDDIFLVKSELLTKLRSPEYDYIRQCGPLKFFTRYRTYKNNQETSASWHSIETLLVPAAAIGNPNLRGNLEKMMISGGGTSVPKK